MGEEMTPVTAGAQYRDVTTGDNHGEKIRVKSVWIDEDGSILISVFSENAISRRETRRTIDKETFLDRLDADEIIRTNSDHEAWEWRNK
jgi:uncharacterized protein YpmB